MLIYLLPVFHLIVIYLIFVHWCLKWYWNFKLNCVGSSVCVYISRVSLIIMYNSVLERDIKQ